MESLRKAIKRRNGDYMACRSLGRALVVSTVPVQGASTVGERGDLASTLTPWLQATDEPPVSVAVKGPSSGGKSNMVGRYWTELRTFEIRINLQPSPD